MCGFLCIVRKNKEIIDSYSKNIPENLYTNRGPDFTSELIFENIQLRHWRLSIVDLSKNSNQPIEDENSIFVYNGEIYDYQNILNNTGEQFKSDTLAVKHLIQDYNGINTLYSLPGFFALLYISKDKGSIFGSRDIFGKKPLFYFINKDVAIFSSDERGIKKYLENTKLNEKSIREYILYKDIFAGKSYYENINEIPPGSSFEFDKKKWKINFSSSWNEYYKKDFYDNFLLNKNLCTKKNNLEIFEDELSKAINRRLSCDVPVQIGISGGVDSTLISAIASQTSNKKNIERAINISFLSKKDESLEAENTAKKLDINFSKVNFNINNFTELLKLAIKNNNGPLSHPHSLAVLEMCREAKKSGKVLITGEGADELFYGYDHYINFKNNSFAFREYLTEIENELFLNIKDNSKSFLEDLRDIANQELFTKANKSAYDSINYEIKTHLLSLLKRNDRMGMAHSIEIRCPFLDHNLFFLIKNSDRKKNLKLRKEILNKILKKNFPLLHQKRKKIGFIVPFDENFKYISQTIDGNKWIDLALDFIRSTYQYCVDDKKDLTPRIGWTLLNLGCFLDNN